MEFYMSEESEHVNDLWEDMDRLNSLYEETDVGSR